MTAMREHLSCSDPISKHVALHMGSLPKTIFANGVK
jgi:hypothetical protein